MREKPPEKDRSERYLLTYADLMNLLLILFIVLFCTSKQDVVATSKVLDEIKGGFVYTGATSSAGASSGNNSRTTSSKGVDSAKLTKPTKTADYSDFYNQLIGLLKQRGLLNKVDITATNNEVIISLKDNVLFGSGKADLDPDATSLLKNMGSLMTKISFGQIIIEGHTDSDPINTSQFPDNTWLSVTRSCNVFEIFKQCGLDPAKILPVGYGEYYPVAKNDTDANKAKNRRVVITIIRKALTPADESVTTQDIITTMQDAAKGKTESASSALSTKASSKATTANP